ncbi:MAG: ferredoxin family protein [Pseudomonas sp.]|uniref:4Fe-4S dicluster domain-containing protein n=1 Tax=Pseudomonas abieticivorans TaxID=2931382 RepID=UPI0020C119E7|nr:ferredoxin family protein [Pseudomonas sp. PIA16]MDE1164634.1 ferredoxin family protein [Pseudomonas sp.]
MIELIFSDLCSGCQKCIAVCPTNVLQPGPRGTPRIGDVHACQTCFMCELYCPNDALYVDPHCDTLQHPDPRQILASGLLGQYRRDSGWDEWADDPRHQNEHWRMDGVFQLARGQH